MSAKKLDREIVKKIQEKREKKIGILTREANNFMQNLTFMLYTMLTISMQILFKISCAA